MVRMNGVATENMEESKNVQKQWRIKMLPVVGHVHGLRETLRVRTHGDGKCHVDAHEIHTCIIIYYDLQLSRFVG